MTTQNFKTLHVYDTKFSADSVEWCPIAPYKTCFACGTYQLDDNKNKLYDEERKRLHVRNGTLSVLSICKDKLEVNYTTICPAILDLKWCGRKVKDKIILAAANAVGEVMVYECENKILNFLSKCILKKRPGDFLTLSLDWTKHGSEDLICTSDSIGNVTVIKFVNRNLIILKEWNAHSLEAWIVCFDSFQPNVIYSGGDDCLLKVWDCRSGGADRIATSKKHSAGVTALSSNVYRNFVLASGSYDERVFIWDTRNWKEPRDIIRANGGLWRIKWEPNSRSCYLLSACIYGGFQIYDTNSLATVGEFKEHQSLAYGADWCHLSKNEVTDLLGYDGSALLGTCSFYDHKLCISLWSENQVS